MFLVVMPQIAPYTTRQHTRQGGAIAALYLSIYPIHRLITALVIRLDSKRVIALSKPRNIAYMKKPPPFTAPLISPNRLMALAVNPIAVRLNSAVLAMISERQGFHVPNGEQNYFVHSVLPPPCGRGSVSQPDRFGKNG